ncbi:hypothetical protein HID58_024528 [Brassica napus]|uniref:Uncharacterized protein n=1 Tax=Brassica napus TaxID=3708 RepID=A0ABQ7XG95_BRANA|nr:hypothetical protein HID58_024528 [Brassica napus]
MERKRFVFPFISDTGNNDVVASVRFKRDDERRKMNDKFVWQVEEDMRTQDQLHEKVDVAVEASQDQIDGKR